MNLKVDSKITIFIFLTIILVFVSESRTETPVSIYVKPKQFSGLSKQIDGKSVNVFLGIPYAKPPIGELRFKKPVPITQYSEPVNAVKWPNPCMQTPGVLQTAGKSLIENTNFSEDCLYLNIWSPGNGQTEHPEPKPVLVFIHGGGFYSGASNIEHTDGEVLAAKGDVVVVTFNYRLGWFGFLYADSDEAPGNMGLWDQTLALKWVNENIGFFGGDPNGITIMGEEVGAQSVALHILSPVTRNFFRNAIMISGGPLAHTFKDSESAKRMWTNIAQDFQCSEQQFSDGSVECLRSVKAQNLIESAFDKRYKTDVNIIKPFIVFGDEFLPKSPSKMLRSSDFKKNVHLLVGTTTDEGSDVLTLTVDPNKYSLSTPQNFSKTEVRAELKNVFKRFFPNITVSTEDIYRLYVSQLPENDYQVVRQAVGVALGDYIRTCPALVFAKELYANGDRVKTKVFQYLWSAEYDHVWHGPNHSTTVRFIFGGPFRANLTSEILNEKKVSLKAIRAVANFAKYGTPNTQQGIEWLSYYSIAEKVINPYYEFTKRYFSNSDFSTGYKYQCSALWQNYLF